MASDFVNNPELSIPVQACFSDEQRFNLMVIPAKAGIQQKYVPQSGQNRIFVRFAELFNDLDSRLRGNDVIFWPNGHSGMI